MANKIVVHKTAAYGGGTTSVMDQATAKAYLAKLVGPGSRLTNLGQALTKACNGEGKSNGKLTFGTVTDTRHASAGVDGVSSVSLFFYEAGGVLNIFAMGQHKGSDSYELCDFRPATGNFSSKSIQL